jgi:hypothetical protein
MQACDYLFFHQLLLPICAPERSGIGGDQCDGYYVKVTDWMAWYAIEGKYTTFYIYAFHNPVVCSIVWCPCPRRCEGKQPWYHLHTLVTWCQVR